MNDLRLVLFPFALFFAGLFVFVLMRRPKTCPDCNKPLPRTQSPFTVTKRQWFEGGYLCPSCGCETDIAGTKVPSGTPPQRWSIVRAIGLLTLAIVPAVLLLALLFQQ